MHRAFTQLQGAALGLQTLYLELPGRGRVLVIKVAEAGLRAEPVPRVR